MTRRAEHLGMSSLDTDAEEEKRQAQEKAGNAAGWISVPTALRRTPRDAMVPEFARRIKLEQLARDVLDVVKDMELEGNLGLRCLAFGFLSLMMVEEVPRKWLAETVRGMEEYKGLVGFAEGFREEVFKGREVDLLRDEVVESALGLTVRFLEAVVCEVPWVGGEWRRRATVRRRRKMLEDSGVKVWEEGEGGGLVLAGAGAAALAVGVGVFFYRRLPPFGVAVQVWKAPVLTFGSLGAAGAMLGSVFGGVDGAY